MIRCGTVVAVRMVALGVTVGGRLGGWRAPSANTLQLVPPGGLA